MRQISILLIFILLVSLCTSLNPFGSEEVLQSGVSIIDIGSPDIFLKIESVPKEIRSGRTILLVFELRNKNDFDLTNIEVEAYDTCVFSGDSREQISVLKADATKTWTWTWNSEEVDLDRDCKIKFRTSYRASNSIFQDIVVLDEAEYYQRELQGTLNEIPIESSFPPSPLRIGLRFSDSQPFIDNEEYYIYIDYNNVAGGFVNVEAGSITIGFPTNAGDVSCGGYSSIEEAPAYIPVWGCCHWIWGPGQSRCDVTQRFECGLTLYNGVYGSWHDPETTNSVCCVSGENEGYCSDPDLCEEALPVPSTEVLEELTNLVLEDEMNFVNKKGPPTTCTFTTSELSEPLKIETLRIKANYEYIIDNLITVKVKK